ncbi:MAG: hypothetical protein A3G87_05130 [Omnitrophica bacterium RIFCSPLOWO2_12_FULL_50_11]|nr:MAG: hypothetical protein A3G87_05130 [Omnitrophica bacterium RIFCSPLOWO2_12_FULL_50_11]
MGHQVPIFICAGSTGGHFFPALSFAITLRDRHPEADLHFLMNRVPTFATRALESQNMFYHLIPCSRPDRFFSLQATRFLLDYLVAFCKTIILLVRWKPCLLVGFGSYSSIPGVLAASFVKVPILLHEQNVTPGRANQFLCFWADRIAVSFQETMKWLTQEKVIWTGFPLRRTFLDELRPIRHVKERTRWTLLVLGGSQGARRLNRVFLDAMRSMGVEERQKFAVIHIVGSDDLNLIRKAYDELGMTCEVVEFTDQISDRLKAADLVIARSGAGTIFELAAIGCASILVPYPHAYAHQETNASYLEACGAAHVIPEAIVSGRALREAIGYLRDHAAKRSLLKERIRQFVCPKANEALVEVAWSLQCGTKAN